MQNPHFWLSWSLSLTVLEDGRALCKKWSLMHAEVVGLTESHTLSTVPIALSQSWKLFSRPQPEEKRRKRMRREKRARLEKNQKKLQLTTLNLRWGLFVCSSTSALLVSFWCLPQNQEFKLAPHYFHQICPSVPVLKGFQATAMLFRIYLQDASPDLHSPFPFFTCNANKLAKICSLGPFTFEELLRPRNSILICMLNVFGGWRGRRIFNCDQGQRAPLKHSSNQDFQVMAFPAKFWVSVWWKIEIRADIILLSRLKGAIAGPITETSKISCWYCAQ